MTTGWQPIETAPRVYGQKMLMWVKSKNGAVIGTRVVEYLTSFAPFGEVLWLAGWGSVDDNIRILARKPARGKFAPKYHATHWMPLPAPPTGE